MTPCLNRYCVFALFVFPSSICWRVLCRSQPRSFSHLYCRFTRSMYFLNPFSSLVKMFHRLSKLTYCRSNGLPVVLSVVGTSHPGGMVVENGWFRDVTAVDRITFRWIVTSELAIEHWPSSSPPRCRSWYGCVDIPAWVRNTVLLWHLYGPVFSCALSVNTCNEQPHRRDPFLVPRLSSNSFLGPSWKFVLGKSNMIILEEV